MAPSYKSCPTHRQASRRPPVAGASLGGESFLDYDSVDGSSNIVGYPASDLSDAFNCMSSVGNEGCGFEHQLESPYRALHDDIPENAGFLRDDALLVVVIVTDEDDCSAPDDSDLFVDSPDADAQYGILHSFRCTQWGVSCTTPPAPLDPTSTGPFDDCTPLDQADGGKLYDVQRYIDFFDRPGGVKADPSDVIFATIAAPPSPVGVTITTPCADQKAASCPILQQSCSDQNVFGDPGVRIAAVAGANLNAIQWSTCDTPYGGVLADLAQKIVARLK